MLIWTGRHVQARPELAGHHFSQAAVQAGHDTIGTRVAPSALKDAAAAHIGQDVCTANSAEPGSTCAACDNVC